MINLPKDLKPIVLVGDVIKRLADIPSNSIDLIVTSPPYWGQRDYNVKGQLGAEKTPDEYINKMLEIADNLKRVLKESGAYFLNIGDKYRNKNLEMVPFKLAIKMQQNGWVLRNIIIWNKTNPIPSSIKDRFSNVYEPIFFFVKDTGKYLTPNYYFDLDSIRIPHKSIKTDQTKLVEESSLPLTLSEEEYEKYKDKIEKKEYNGKFKGASRINLGASPGARLSVFGEFYSKQRKYKIKPELELEIIDYLRKYKKEKNISSEEIDKVFGYKDTAGHWFRKDLGGRSLPKPEDWLKLKEIVGITDNKYDKIMTEIHYVLQTVRPHEGGKNPGDIWSFATGKLQYSHFAIFPEELPRRAILSSCPANGIVLDPFVGSGTTLKVAKELGRRSIGIELQRKYIDIIKKRCGELIEL